MQSRSATGAELKALLAITHSTLHAITDAKWSPRHHCLPLRFHGWSFFARGVVSLALSYRKRAFPSPLRPPGRLVSYRYLCLYVRATSLRGQPHEVLHTEPVGESGEIKRARLKTVRPPNSGRVQAQEHKSEFRTLVGGPGFEPGASRSRTVLVACPPVSRRLPRCPPELKLQLLGVRPCPPRAAWCRESVPRLCPGACLKRWGTCDHLALGSGITGASGDPVQPVDLVGRSFRNANQIPIRGSLIRLA